MKEINGTTQDKIPYYLTYEKAWQKHQFLKDAGITEHAEINVFDLLCAFTAKAKKALIGVNEFLSVMDLWAQEKGRADFKGKNGKANLFSLLEKLEKNYCVEIEKSDNNPVTFLLKEPGKLAKLDRKIIEAIRKNYAELDYDLQKPFAQNDQFDIPDNMIAKLCFREFNKESIAKYSASDSIVLITFSKDAGIICLSENFGTLLDLSHKKVHVTITNNRELYEYVFLELRKLLPSKTELRATRFFEYLERKTEVEESFWIYLSMAISKSREKASQVQKMDAGNISFYQAAYLLHAYYNHKLEVEKQARRKESDKRCLLQRMQNETRFFSMEDLRATRDKKGVPLSEKHEDFDDLLASFLDRHMTKKEDARVQPEILKIDNYFIHKDVVFDLFFDLLSKAFAHCHDHFRDKWRQFLEQQNYKEKTMLNDIDFNLEIEAQIRKKHPFLEMLLRKPHIVHTAMAERIESNQSLRKRQAYLFAPVNELRFKELNTILSLDREKIINSLISQYSFFQKFLAKWRLKLKNNDSKTRRQEEVKDIGSSKILLGQTSPSNKAIDKRKRRIKPTERKKQFKQNLAREHGKSKIKRTAQQRIRKKSKPSKLNGAKKMDTAVEEFREAIDKKTGNGIYKKHQ